MFKFYCRYYNICDFLFYVLKSPIRFNVENILPHRRCTVYGRFYVERSSDTDVLGRIWLKSTTISKCINV